METNRSFIGEYVDDMVSTFIWYVCVRAIFRFFAWYVFRPTGILISSCCILLIYFAMVTLRLLINTVRVHLRHKSPITILSMRELRGVLYEHKLPGIIQPRTKSLCIRPSI